MAEMDEWTGFAEDAEILPFTIELDHAGQSLGLRYKRFEHGPLFVSDVDPGLPSDRAGIYPGLAIIAVAGEEVPTEGDLLQVLNEFRASGELALSVELTPYLDFHPDGDIAGIAPGADEEVEEYGEGGGTVDQGDVDTFIAVVDHPGQTLGLRWATNDRGAVYAHTVWGAMAAAGVPTGLEILQFDGVPITDEETLLDALQEWRARGDLEVEVVGIVPVAGPVAPQYWPWAGERGDAEYPPPPRPVGGGFGGPLPEPGQASSMQRRRWAGAQRVPIGSPLRGASARTGGGPGIARRAGPARFTVGEGASGLGPGRARSPGDTWAAYAVRRTRHGGTGGFYDSYVTPQFEEIPIGGVSAPLPPEEAEFGGLTAPRAAARPLTTQAHRRAGPATGSGYYSVVNF